MLTEKNNEIGFLLFDGFPMACLTSVIEPLRAANEIAGQEAFCWSLVTEDGDKVRSSANVRFEAERDLSDCRSIDILFLLSSPTSAFKNPAQANGALRGLARHGTILGGLSGGVFPLVRSGVMAGYPVSVHWCYEAAFEAEFPDMDARREVIVSGVKRYTAAGAAAAFDLALHLIEDRLGSDVAHEVACWFQHPLMRGEGVRQQVPNTSGSDTGEDLPPLVAKCVDLFAGRIGDPISIAEVADLAGVTPRQIERAFKQATGQSPSHYFRAMRMKAARQMVVYTKDPIADIAAAIGYSSAAPLVTHYRSAFGLSPSEDRRRINRFRVQDNAPLPSS